MADKNVPEEVDVEKIKKALVSAGILKSVKLSAEDEAHIHKNLATHGIDALRFPFGIRIICHSSHYCIVVKGI